MTEEVANVKAKNPFKKGTKKFLVAERLFRGEIDNQKIAEEVGVEKGTVYSVKSILRGLGLYPKKPGKPKSNLPALQEPSPASSPEGSPDNTAHEASKPATLPESSPELIEKIAGKVVELLRSGEEHEREGLSVGLMPIEAEDVEVIGEKVNYKVALNPEIFWRYNVFKAETERRGRKWAGNFSDFLDLATKDILAVYGIHPTVVSLKGKKLMVELPVEMGGED